MFHTFNSKSQEKNTPGDSRNPNPNSTLDVEMYSSNFLKSENDVGKGNRRGKIRNKKRKKSLRKKQFLDVPRPKIHSQATSVTSTNKFLSQRSINTRKYSQRQDGMRSHSRNKGRISNAPSIIQENAILNGNSEVIGYLYMPEQYLNHDGWNVFVRGSSKTPDKSGGQTGDARKRGKRDCSASLR